MISIKERIHGKTHAVIVDVILFSFLLSFLMLPLFLLKSDLNPTILKYFTYFLPVTATLIEMISESFISKLNYYFHTYAI